MKNSIRQLSCSIIIPTYNRAAMLPITLQSFIDQDFDKTKFEIIVSNNNSTDDTASVVESYQKKYPTIIKSVFEPRQGVHYARNTAAKQARGEILYFTDDDMIAESDLLKNLLSIFAFDHRIASATGTVLPKWEQPPPAWVLENCMNGLLSLNVREEELIIAPFDIGVYSCHQAIKRNYFFESGGFNPENTAGDWIGDGETGLNIKIKLLGGLFGFVKSSVIWHMIPLARMTQSYLNRRLFNQGNCDSYTAYRRDLPTRLKMFLKLPKYWIQIGLTVTKSLLYYLKRRSAWHIYFAYIFYYWARFRYDIRLIRKPNWRTLVLKQDWLNESDIP